MKVPGYPPMPRLTFKTLVVRLYREIMEDDVPSLAGQMAYFFLFSIFPGLVFLVALLGFLPLEEPTRRFLAQIKPVVPEEFYRIVADQFINMVTVERPGLLSVGAAIALYGASSAIRATMTALNRAYDVAERRSFIKTQLTSLALTFLASLSILLALALIIGGDLVASYLEARFAATIGQTYALAWRALRWLVAPGAVLFSLAFLYRFGPDVDQPWRWVTPGSILTTVLWLAATSGFSFYVKNFGNFNATYGSLGGVMISMIWLYLSGLVVLIGGELNAVLEQASTEGPEHEKRAPTPIGDDGRKETGSSPGGLEACGLPRPPPPQEVAPARRPSASGPRRGGPAPEKPPQRQREPSYPGPAGPAGADRPGQRPAGSGLEGAARRLEEASRELRRRSPAS